CAFFFFWVVFNRLRTKVFWRGGDPWVAEGVFVGVWNWIGHENRIAFAWFGTEKVVRALYSGLYYI
ncbi:hypothetical protein ACFSKN_14895, partial [Mariniflexile gromovii]